MIEIKRARGIGGGITMCFILSFGSAVTYSVNCILFSAGNTPPDTANWKTLVLFVSFALFFWSLLLTLIVRLYSIFKPSVFRMSNKLIVMFTIIMVLFALVC